MILVNFEIYDFRNYQFARIESIPPGIVAIVGNNGQGKTSIIEAIGYLSNKNSFRGASKDVIIRYGQDQSVIRGGFVSSLGRDLLIEASISKTHPDKFFINKQQQSRVSHLSNTVPTTIFSSNDIEVVRGSPSLRRNFLDSGVSMIYPKGDSVISAVEKILRQRATLLKQSGGKLTPEISATLEVWDRQLSFYGEQLVKFRQDLLNLISPYISKAYKEISESGDQMSLAYAKSWDGDLIDELGKSRAEDLRRQVNSIGPHRDDLEINLNNHPVKHNGSQGEQRTAAFALKVALHSLYRETTGEDPILLLDDVFSELDEDRSMALLGSISAKQTFITTTGTIPGVVEPSLQISVKKGSIVDTL